MLDDFNREALGIEVSFLLPSERVIRALDQIIAWRGKPSIIHADNGPELVSARLMEWAANHQRPNMALGGNTPETATGHDCLMNPTSGFGKIGRRWGIAEKKL